MCRRHIFRAGAVIAALACSDSTAPDVGCRVETNTPAPVGIALSINPSCASVTRGAVAEFTATVTVVGGFMGAIRHPVELEGLPAGVTSGGSDVTINPPPGGSSEHVSILVAPSAAVGTFTIIVRARATGVPDATNRLTLTIR